MLLSRTRLLPFILSAVASFAGCSGPASEIAPELAAELGRSDARATALSESVEAASTPREVERGDAIALGYLERHRLGLGSPWRLIDYALHDDRLADSTRHHVAWSLLARTISSAEDERYLGALDVIAGRSGRGRWHADLIDSVISAASDPRIGELTLRLAYAISGAENKAGHEALLVSSHAAALARDRVHARRDAYLLLRAAEDAGVDPVSLVGPWRADRRFLAEQPTLVNHSTEAEAEAIAHVPRVLAAIRAIEALPPSPELRPGSEEAKAGARIRSGQRHGAVPETESLLGPAAAQRLAELAATHGAPPQAPVLLAIRGYRSRILTGQDPDGHGARRARFVGRVTNEESLAAEYALLAVEGARSRAADLSVLTAAVSLRPYAQEPVWFPGMPGLSVTDVKASLGLASVSFDADVPAEWRPFYLRMLAEGVTDLQRVLPELSLAGAGIHFGESVMGDAALALHDPSTRTIYLPISSGAGALAHEVMHDLDWQFARSRFGRQGGYGTDRAVRERSGPTASSLRGLTTAMLVPPMPQNGFRPPHAQRPAEVFARNADWFIVASLARQGRMNGYLSAVQDELLAGYVAAEVPDPTGAGGTALVELLDDMTVLPAATRDWFLSAFGRGRDRRAFDLVQAVLKAPLPTEQLHHALPHALDPLRTLLPLTPCGAWSSGAEGRAEGALRAVALLAADVRARTIVETAGSVRHSPTGTVPGPWSNHVAELEVARVRNALLSWLDAQAAEHQPFGVGRTGAGCGG